MKLNKKQISILEKNGAFTIDLNTMTNQFGEQVGMYKNTMVINNKKNFKLQFIGEISNPLNYTQAIKIASFYIKNENQIKNIEGFYGNFIITYHHHLDLNI